MRHKKLLLFLAFLFGSAALSYAQQIPLMSQYYFNDYLYNPSRAGASISPNAFFGYRNQWTGLKGAPQTNIFAIDMMIPKHYSGLGFKIYQDKIHISERTNVMLSYSYHAVLSKNQVLSFGLSAGASSLRVNLSDLDNTLLDPNDPILAAYAGNENSMGFEADFGIHYRLGHLHVGVSVPQIYTSGIQYETNKATTQYNFVRHNLISAKYSFHFNEVHKLEPLLMLRSAQGIPAQWDFGGVYTYDNMVWGGITYREQYAISISAGFLLQEKFKLGYSYDHPISDIRNVAGNTHEIMIGFRFGHSINLDRIKFMEQIDPDISWFNHIAKDPEKQAKYSKHLRKKARKGKR